MEKIGMNIAICGPLFGYNERALRSYYTVIIGNEVILSTAFVQKKEFIGDLKENIYVGRKSITGEKKRRK